MSNWSIAGQKKDHTPNLCTNSPLPFPCQQPTRLVWDNLNEILMMSSYRKPNALTNNYSSLYGRLNVKEDKGRTQIRTMFPFFGGLSEKVQIQIHPPHQEIWPVIFCTQFAGEAPYHRSPLLDLFASILLGRKHCSHLSCKIQKRLILENIAPLLHQLVYPVLCYLGSPILRMFTKCQHSSLK